MLQRYNTIIRMDSLTQSNLDSLQVFDLYSSQGLVDVTPNLPAWVPAQPASASAHVPQKLCCSPPQDDHKLSGSPPGPSCCQGKR